MGKGRLRGQKEVLQDGGGAASLGRERRKERNPKAPRAISGSCLYLNWETWRLYLTPHPPQGLSGIWQDQGGLGGAGYHDCSLCCALIQGLLLVASHSSRDWRRSLP